MPLTCTTCPLLGEITGTWKPGQQKHLHLQLSHKGMHGWPGGPEHLSDFVPSSNFLWYINFY